MAELKLSKLPDRRSVKLAINISPELGQSLADYAELYRQTYGENESVPDLIPAMLAGFLESDRVFCRRRKMEKGS